MLDPQNVRDLVPLVNTIWSFVAGQVLAVCVQRYPESVPVSNSWEWTHDGVATRQIEARRHSSAEEKFMSYHLNHAHGVLCGIWVAKARAILNAS